MPDRRGGFLTDLSGNYLYQNQPVHFNEAGLKEMAQIAGGKFFRATDTKSLEQIFDEIDKLEKSTVTMKKFQQYRDLFPVCIMAGLRVAARAVALSANRLEKAAVKRSFTSVLRIGSGRCSCSRRLALLFCPRRATQRETPRARSSRHACCRSSARR